VRSQWDKIRGVNVGGFLIARPLLTIIIAHRLTV
jgi:hypothetical protein